MNFLAMSGAVGIKSSQVPSVKTESFARENYLLMKIIPGVDEIAKELLELRHLNFLLAMCSRNLFEIVFPI